MFQRTLLQLMIIQLAPGSSNVPLYNHMQQYYNVHLLLGNNFNSNIFQFWNSTHTNLSNVWQLVYCE